MGGNEEQSEVAGFFGPHRFLSSFWPCDVHLDGDAYSTVEHAYQAGKTKDRVLRRRIRQASSPGAAKRLGSEQAALPADERITLMRGLVRQKIATPALRQSLLATGTARLVEANTWGDRFWGVCGGEGTNHLGNLLMVERSRLRGHPPVLALDVEGTIISNVVSALPRAGVRQFIYWASTRFDRLVFFTAAPAPAAHQCIRRLVDLGELPSVAASFQIVGSLGSQKDLRCIHPIAPVLLADDQEASVLPEQRAQWVPVEPWISPYPPDDALTMLRSDLEAALSHIEQSEIDA